MLEQELKSLALEEGCVRVGIARREVFSEAPPSADMRYERPWANSVISFALTTGTEWIEDYLGKVTRTVIKRKMYDTYHNLDRIGALIAKRLEAAGFKAHNMVPNGIYRPDHTFEKDVPDPDMKPPVSLRYMAVGAGVGRFGWSGNVMIPGVWSNAYLGGLLTDAELEPDPLLEEEICDKCRVCARVCPVGFIQDKEETSVTIGGQKHVYNRKRSDLRCLIGCGGYTGLSKDGTWSSWSTGRMQLPDDDAALPETFVKLRANKENAAATRNLTFGSRGILDRPFENTNPTCNQCLTVCSGPVEVRKNLMELLFRSGVVELDQKGQEVVKKPA